MAILERDNATQERPKPKGDRSKYRGDGQQVQSNEEDRKPKTEVPQKSRESSSSSSVSKGRPRSMIPDAWLGMDVTAMKTLRNEYCSKEGIKDGDQLRLLMDTVIARLDSAGPFATVAEIENKV